MARPINLSSVSELWQGHFFPQCAEVASVGCKVTDVHMVNLFQPPWAEGPWLHGGCCRCPQELGPPAGRDLGLAVFCPMQKMCCFLGSSISIPWEPVELQSSALMGDMRVWPHFPVTTLTGDSTRLALTQWEAHGCLMSAAFQASTLPGCCPSAWPTESHKSPKAVFPHCFYLTLHLDGISESISSFPFILKSTAWNHVSCICLI